MNHIYVYSTHFYLYIYLGADKENLFIDQELH